MKENDQILDGSTNDSISIDVDMDKTMAEEVNLKEDESDEEIIELVDLIEKGPGIEEDLAVTLEDLPEKATGEAEEDFQLFSDEELALGDDVSEVAASEAAEVTQLFEEEKQEVVEKVETAEISETDLTSILEEDVSATVVLDSEPDQIAEETQDTVMDLGNDEAIEKILEPVIEKEEELEASLEPDFLEEKAMPTESRADASAEKEFERAAESAQELNFEEREEAVIDLTPEPVKEGEDTAAAAEETTVMMGVEAITENLEGAPMESIEETLDLTTESLKEEKETPASEDVLVDDLDQFLMEDSEAVKEPAATEIVEESSATEKGIELEAGGPGDVEKEESQEVIVEEDQASASEERLEEPETASAGGISDKRLEETVRNVVEEVVERVARETMASVAEKVITEAIDALKESLEASSE